MTSHHTAITGTNSLEHKGRYDILTDMRSGAFWLRYRTPISGIDSSGKYIGFGLRIERGAERTNIIVDIFDTIQQVQDTGIDLKVDEE